MKTKTIVNGAKKVVCTMATEVKKGVTKTQNFINLELKIVELESEKESLIKQLGERAYKDNVIDNVIVTKLDKINSELNELENKK